MGASLQVSSLTSSDSSSIIENVSHHCRINQSFAYAYFFFDARDSQNALQLHENLLRSLIRQLCHLCNAVPNTLSELYRTCHNGDSQPSIDSLQKTFLSILDGFQHV